jgi:hypothetical protein
MPKLPMNYDDTIIYKLCCNDVNITDIYVGHTTNFTKRKSLHKHCCNNDGNENHHLYIYQFIREKGGWDNWSMVEIEKFNCASKNEAEKRERYWIETLQAKLNNQIPTRTANEYYEDNKEKISENKKQYYEDNKNKINEKITCPCGGKYTCCHKFHHSKTKIHQDHLKNNIL